MVDLNRDYFSGTQASIFIGDTWVDDIISIDYQLQHNRTPIYGYGSQKYDFLPEGAILVTGSFTVNFREPNYLWMILARYQAFNPSGLSVRSTSEESRSDRSAQKAGQAAKTQLDSFPDDPRRNFDLFMNQTTPKGADAVRDELNSSLASFPQARATSENFNHSSFTITIGYGADLENAIGERLSQVQIMGKSKIIQASGQPIQEAYSFIARDIS